MKSTTIAIDVAKDVFELAIAHQKLRVTDSMRLSRQQFLAWLENREVKQIDMEACGSASPEQRSERIQCLSRSHASCRIEYVALG
jgi:hypothetical protein